MNKCIFTGRLGNTPELRTTKSGVPVCTFTLAVDRPKAKDNEQEVDWLTFVAWRNNAEFVSRHLSKGRKVLVIASVRTRSYEDKHGNNRKVTEFYTEDIEFCDRKPEGSAQGEQVLPETQSPVGFTEYDGSDDDMPF